MRRVLLGLCMLILIGTVVVWAAPNPQANLFQLFVLEARTDLETLANAALGEGVRPEEWTFNTDLESETVVVDLWFDNEVLADEVFGEGTRPAEWFGATSSNAELVARNVRHDMEITADTVFEGRERPENWNGAAPVFRCDRTTQNLIRLLDTIYNTRPTTAASVLDYCRAVNDEIENELSSVIFEQSATPEDQLPALVLAVRGDLERLANELLGVGSRPSTWVGNVEQNSPTLAADTAADLERLADLELGSDVRPEEWSSFVTTSPALAYRNLRFNLELLADLSLGEDVRPNGWQGEDPLTRCDVNVQALVFILERNLDFTVDQTLSDSPNFCELTEFTANSIAENPPEIDVEEEEALRYTAESNFAFSYLDVAALDYMGIMPAGTKFRAWYRNFNESNMMFVSGDNFAVYIDRRFTTMEEEIFRTLPTLDGVIPLAFCDANWCNGPGPTPTPTGSGALLAILSGGTPQATQFVPSGGGQDGQLTQVSWNHIRVTYLLDRPEIGTVQVALEICAEPQQITCEPVVSVFDNGLGTFKPVLSQYNGLNVYEFRYGYNQNVRVEGQLYVSPDIWISDPTIR